MSEHPRYRDDPFTREVLHGVELITPRPAIRHGISASRLGMVLGPYDHALHQLDEDDQGGPPTGPGGWWLIDEPELHLEGEDDPIVPDLAGW